MKPRKPLPASPMKTFAGDQFQIRKPSTEAARAKRAKETGVPFVRKAPVDAARTASPAARPSMPSMKL